MSGQVYEYLGTGSSPPTQTVWLDLTTNTEQIWSAGPGPTDTWLFTHDQDVDGYPIFSRGESFGTLVLVPNVNVILSGFGGDGNSYVGLAADKVIVGPGANFTMYGGLHGNELIIGPGATATFNEIPAPGPGGGVGSDFANLINSGTLSVGPQTANGGFATSLALGGPGFVQTTGFTSGESRGQRRRRPYRRLPRQHRTRHCLGCHQRSYHQRTSGRGFQLPSARPSLHQLQHRYGQPTGPPRA